MPPPSLFSPHPTSYLENPEPCVCSARPLLLLCLCSAHGSAVASPTLPFFSPGIVWPRRVAEFAFIHYPVIQFSSKDRIKFRLSRAPRRTAPHHKTAASSSFGLVENDATEQKEALHAHRHRTHSSPPPLARPCQPCQPLATYSPGVPSVRARASPAPVTTSFPQSQVTHAHTQRTSSSGETCCLSTSTPLIHLRVRR